MASETWGEICILLVNFFSDVTWIDATSVASIIFFLICSALMSGSEVAFFSLTHAEINSLKEGKHRREQRVYSLISKPRELLAILLIFNTFVNVAIVILSSFLAHKYLLIWHAPDWLFFVVETLIITFILVFFGEVTPKVYAVQKRQTFVRFMAFPMTILSWLLYPLTRIFVSSTEFMERRFARKYSDVSAEELKHAIELTSEEDTPREEKEILKGIIEFGKVSVKQIMRPRTDIMTVDIKTKFEVLLKKISDETFSRIPVYDSSLDDIKGILYIKDLLPYLNEKDFEWEKLIRPAYYIPESKKLDDLLKEFQSQHIHMAVVADEFGGTSGIVTMEDIIEQIVGEISEETGEISVRYTRLDENNYVFDGKTLLTDVIKILDLDSDYFNEVKGSSDAFGGLLTELHGNIPKVGEKMKFRDFIFTIEAVAKTRIVRIKLSLMKKDEASE